MSTETPRCSTSHRAQDVGPSRRSQHGPHSASLSSHIIRQQSPIKCGGAIELRLGCPTARCSVDGLGGADARCSRSHCRWKNVSLQKKRAVHSADECPHGLWCLDSIICCSPLPAHIYQDEEATKQHGAEGIVLDAPAATKNGHSDKTSAIFGCRHSACSQEQGWRCSGGNCKAIRR